MKIQVALTDVEDALLKSSSNVKKPKIPWSLVTGGTLKSQVNQN